MHVLVDARLYNRVFFTLEKVQQRAVTIILGNNTDLTHIVDSLKKLNLPTFSNWYIAVI